MQLRIDLYGAERQLDYANHGGPAFNPGRLTRLIEFVSERIGFGKSLPSGRGIGIASHFTFGGAGADYCDIRSNRQAYSPAADTESAKRVAFPAVGVASAANGVPVDWDSRLVAFGRPVLRDIITSM